MVEAKKDIGTEFGEIRQGFFFRTLTPREFVSADLDSLADAGMFPERDMLAVFQSHADELIRPSFWSDREFDAALRAYVAVSAARSQELVSLHHIDAIGIENIDFFIYCCCMVMNKGKWLNPYAGFEIHDETRLKAAFRHIVVDEPVSIMRQKDMEPLDLPTEEIRSRLRYRGILRANGSLDRNALKAAIIELQWITLADLCDDIQDRTKLIWSMPKEILSAYAEMYLKIYVSHLIIKYTKISLSSDEWFIDAAFKILEALLCRVDNQTPRGRDDIRLRATGFLAKFAQQSGRTVEESVALCIQTASDIGYMRMISKTTTTLDLFYIVATVFEFAEDINPIEERPSF